MTLEEWKERAERGTSGDMVYAILQDWEKEIAELAWGESVESVADKAV
jgi:hypothetical protein